MALAAYTAHNLPDGMEPGLMETAFFDPSNFSFPAGCHICEVEVDPDTGTTEITQFVAADDFGTIINPMIVDGQVHGGVAQGIGQALLETCAYDGETGQLLTASYMDYTMPRADDLPSFTVETTKTESPSNPLGLKGCGEAGAIGSPPAVINAITDAIGNNNLSMPATSAGRLVGDEGLGPRGKDTKMYKTNYHRASSVDEAANLIAGADDGKLLAGGQTLIPTMKQRLAAPSDLVDLRHIADLKGISVAGSQVTIGAGTTHADVANSAELRGVCPALADLASHIGDPHVRNMGTIGGSIANNDPAADYPAAMVALNAVIHTNSRQISASDFFTGMFETALNDGEIITAVTFDAPEKAAYQKFPNPAIALCHGGRIRRQGQWRCIRRCDRRRKRWRVPRIRHGSGTRRQLRLRCARRRQCRSVRHAFRSARIG